MVKKKKRQKRLKVFNLKDEKEAKEYYTLLKRMSREKTKAPILAKGFMRMVDLSQQLKKLDFYPPFESSWTREERQLMNTI